MKIIIKRLLETESIENFVYYYVPLKAYDLYNETVDLNKIKPFSDYLNMDCDKALQFALTSLKPNKLFEGGYELVFDNATKLNDITLEAIVNFVTYGNLSIKGYDIIRKIFEYIETNINDIYAEWETTDVN